MVTKYRWILRVQPIEILLAMTGFLIVLSIILSICFPFDSNRSIVKKIRVDHFKSVVHGLFNEIAVLMVDEGEGWQPLYSGIEGFDYQWGFEYELTIRLQKIPSPPADGSSIRYFLINIDKISKIPEGTRFRIPVHANSEQISMQHHWAFWGERKFKCRNGEVEKRLEDCLASRMKMRNGMFWLEFSHPKHHTDPLMIESVLDE